MIRLKIEQTRLYKKKIYQYEFTLSFLTLCLFCAVDVAENAIGVVVCTISVVEGAIGVVVCEIGVVLCLWVFFNDLTWLLIRRQLLSILFANSELIAP